MTSTLLKYNVIILCIGVTLIHNSSGVTSTNDEEVDITNKVIGGLNDTASVRPANENYDLPLETTNQNESNESTQHFIELVPMETTDSSEKVTKNIDLYYDPQSPQTRSVFLTLEALNLEVNFIAINRATEDPLSKRYPILCLETPAVIMEGGDFILGESHAIIVYLVREYGGNDDHPLYPKDSKIRAQINHILHFDSSTLYLSFKNQYAPWIFSRKPKTTERENKIHNALRYLENILENSHWVAGDSMTVADFSLVASISTFKVAGVDLTRYSKINEWFEKCSTTMVGYTNKNQEGIEDLEVTLKSLDEHFANPPQTQSL